MRSTILRGAAALALSFAVVITALAYGLEDIRVVVNGRTVRFGGGRAPYQRGNIWVVPATDVLNAAGIQYNWDERRDRLTVTERTPYISVQAGDTYYELSNGRRENMRAKAEVFSNALHVPQSFLERALDTSSRYDRNSRTLFFGRDNRPNRPGDIGWGNSGSGSPWYGSGGNDPDERGSSGNSSAFLNINRTQEGTGSVRMNRRPSTGLNRASIVLNNRGSAEIKLWPNSGGVISMKGRYNRRGNTVTVDLWEGLRGRNDRVSGTVTITNDGRNVVRFSLSGVYDDGPFGADFRFS